MLFDFQQGERVKPQLKNQNALDACVTRVCWPCKALIGLVPRDMVQALNRKVALRLDQRNKIAREAKFLKTTPLM